MKKKEKKNNGCLITVICAFIFFILIALFGSGDSTDKNKETAAVATKDDSSNVENVKTEEAEETKETETAKKTKVFKETLCSGNYTVGVDIPSGTYNLKAKSSGGNVSTSDFRLNEIMGTRKEDMYIKTYNNLELENGVVLTLNGVSVELSSINASAEELEERKQNLENVTLSSGNYVASKDFKSGTYNIKAKDGNGNVNTDDFNLNAIIGTRKDEMYLKEYKNVDLKDNVTLTVSGCTIELEPSK